MFSLEDLIYLHIRTAFNEDLDESLSFGRCRQQKMQLNKNFVKEIEEQMQNHVFIYL